jgi:hypothetical protein
MIIKRNESDRLRQLAEPERAEMVKIPGAVQDEWGKARLKLGVKSFNQIRGGGKAQTRSPGSRIDHRQLQRLVAPRLIQV